MSDLQTELSGHTVLDGVVSLPIKGGVVLIDQADLPVVAGLRWCVWRNDGYTFARARTRGAGGARMVVLMHRLIVGLSVGDPRQCAHRDGDGLNNVRGNLIHGLRVRGTRRRNKTGFTGVFLVDGKYRAKIRLNGKRVTSPAFVTAGEAAGEYQRLWEAAQRG